MYAGLSLRNPRSGIRVPQSEKPTGTMQNTFTDSEWLQTICRAGAMVLLVGFWFDGGLFKFATGSVFWTLLELGHVDSDETWASARTVAGRAERHAGNAIACQRSGTEMWIRRIAWVLAIVAIAESAVLTTIPFLPMNHVTLAIARRWLVAPRAVGDFNFLVDKMRAVGAHPSYSPILKIPLQHACLANYNRELTNWTLDDAVYRDYVLWPGLANGAKSDAERETRTSELPSEDFAWRRDLWEYFYPHIRKENNPESAAQVVLKFLRQRLTIVPAGPPTIRQIWRQQKADLKGFETLLVAAFRSVGIPARLNERHEAELFFEGSWRPVPEPPASTP
jgi:hypothetical protein